MVRFGPVRNPASRSRVERINDLLFFGNPEAVAALATAGASALGFREPYEPYVSPVPLPESAIKLAEEVTAINFDADDESGSSRV